MDTAPVTLTFPFRGRWLVQNSPANRVPSHGTDLFGTSFAIDFVAVDAQGVSAPQGWRSVLSTERPEHFVGFGLPVLAPVSGTVVAAVDGEPDHEARRSQSSLLLYALTQARRVREGARAIAGNHVVIAMEPSGPFVLVAHLQLGSVSVLVGSQVDAGHVIGSCGNSGNGTEPHVHVQATDTTAWETARGLPITFEPAGNGDAWMPRNGEIVDV